MKDPRDPEEAAYRNLIRMVHLENGLQGIVRDSFSEGSDDR
jgi:hypothetical protein